MSPQPEMPGKMDVMVTYDRSVDAAFIYLVQIGPGGSERQVEAVPEAIILDFDKDDRLIGIEVLDAKHRLPKSVLESAERI